jgi:serine/threonine protein kinase
MLGSGGFGEVFVGAYVHDGLYRRVAVKRMSPALQLQHQGQTAEQLEEFRRDALSSVKREINVLRNFRHDNIIRLLGYSIPPSSALSRSAATAPLLPPPAPAAAGGEAFQLCLVYELAAEGDLNGHLTDDAKAETLTWKRRIRVASGIACALNYLHCRDSGNPCFHRDVKSSNVALTTALQPKLIDCGLSKYVPEASSAAAMTVFTRTGQRFGTSLYMCPDYATGDDDYNAKSEIYSFGIVLAELLSGKVQGADRVKYDCYSVSDDAIVSDLRAGALV